MNVLVSWIGFADLKSLFGCISDEALLAELKSAVRPPYETSADGGPIKTILSQKSFDEVHLLSTYSKTLTEAYLNSLERDVEIVYKQLESPVDYVSIYESSNEVLSRVENKLTDEKYDLSILLSPGTPAMAAIWVLLGKTKYPATFWQTWQGGVSQANIPFDITLDVVPELMKGSDSAFYHLATKSPSETEGFEGIIGDSSAIRLAVGRAKKASLRDVSVLLNGESGTGKELFARAIHKASSRRDKPFIAINCAAIPKDLLESELFGYAKGAFTGAVKDKPGAFKNADGGILFLDEIGECDPQIQSKLLRVLQPPPGEGPCVREFNPVGSTDVERSNVRILAATNRNLIEMVENNTFREDLFYRLALITITLPALRERKSDVILLAEALLKQINFDFSQHDSSYTNKYFSDNTNIFIKNYDWPGNVRELYNVILQAAVMSNQDELGIEDIKGAVSERPMKSKEDVSLLDEKLGDGFDLEEHIDNIRRHYILRAMKEANGVKKKAADLLGANNYQTMDAQAKRLKLDPNLIYS